MANEVKHGRRLTPEEKLEHRKYRETVNARAPKSKTFSQCILAFLTGGAICCIGQLIGDFGTAVLNLAEQERAAFTSIVLIFAGALLTGIGVYDKLGAIAGAGSVVPITGFANAVISPALEFKSEGSILGTGVKLFSIAGPVIVYGTAASVVFGIIYYIAKTVFGL